MPRTIHLPRKDLPCSAHPAAPRSKRTRSFAPPAARRCQRKRAGEHPRPHQQAPLATPACPQASPAAPCRIPRLPACTRIHHLPSERADQGHRALGSRRVRYGEQHPHHPHDRKELRAHLHGNASRRLRHHHRRHRMDRCHRPPITLRALSLPTIIATVLFVAGIAIAVAGGIGRIAAFAINR